MLGWTDKQPAMGGVQVTTSESGDFKLIAFGALGLAACVGAIVVGLTLAPWLGASGLVISLGASLRLALPAYGEMKERISQGKALEIAAKARLVAARDNDWLLLEGGNDEIA